MKIEVGMYVRSEIYGIAKIKSVWSKTIEIDRNNCYGLNGVTTSRDSIIGKPSFNIIDLIEEGDYVNGDVVIVKYELNELSEGVLPHVITRSGKHIFEDDVVSIVTKEQFENESYKIGDDE